MSGLKIQGRDPVAVEVLDRWRQVDDDLVEDRRNYWLNHAFFRGQQWLWWDYESRVPRFLNERTWTNERVRTTSNQFRPRVNRLVGRLAERNLFFDVQATAADDPTLAGAELAADLLETRRVNDDWESIREENLYNNLFGGTAFVTTEWDSTRGQLWHDTESGETIGEGEVVLQAWSVAEYGLEPASRSRDTARWGIGCRCLPSEQVQAYYELPEAPQADAQQMYSPLQRRLIADKQRSQPERLTAVFIMWERPNALCQSGRVVHVVNGRVVESASTDSWPYPFHHLPVRVFRQSKMPGTYRGDTICNDARQIQVQYNAVRSNLLEHTKLAGNARLWVPHGAVDDELALTDEPGEIQFYHAEVTGGAKPDYSMPAPLPRSLTQQLDELKAELDDIMYSHDVSRGVAPGDRNSGLALSVLAEHNDTPLGPMARGEALGWADIASQSLQLYEANAVEKRKAIIVGDRGIPHVLDWNGDRLRGQHRVTVPQDVTLPQSRAVFAAQLTALAGQFPQLFASVDTPTLGRLLGIANADQLTQILDSDANLAVYENARMGADEVMMPQEWHNHARHIAEHNDYRNSPAWHQLPDENKHLVDLHIQAHQRYAEQEAAQQAQLNAVQPGLAGLPQANAPVGSALPEPIRLQEARQQGAAAA